MKGGVILFRGSGAAARRYVEADRSRADEYYLGADDAVAEYTVLDASGEVTAARSLTADEYEGWVDWINPITGESMGTPRAAAERTNGSPLFAEMTINAPKSLSVATALHPGVSEALDAAQQDALAEIRRWFGQHSVTRVGPREAREVVPIEQMQVVGIRHKTSRAGDPHRHIHMQIGTRVFTAGKWRALDTAALFKQQHLFSRAFLRQSAPWPTRLPSGAPRRLPPRSTCDPGRGTPGQTRGTSCLRRGSRNGRRRKA